MVAVMYGHDQLKLGLPECKSISAVCMDNVDINVPVTVFQEKWKQLIIVIEPCDCCFYPPLMQARNQKFRIDICT